MNPPWLKDGEPERWIGASDFAILVNRAVRTIHFWLSKNPKMLEAFGYKSYQDPTGHWFIQVRRSDLADLATIRDLRKLRKARDSSLTL